MNQIIFDVETKKTFDAVGGYYPEKLGISFVGVIERVGFPDTSVTKEIHHQLFEPDLEKLWPLLESADVIIGFNSDGFDLPALTPYYSGDITILPSLDLLSRIKDSAGHRISLDAVAEVTLGVQKSGHGLDAIQYFHNQEWDKLAGYCMKDVEITKNLYDYGRTHQHVKFKNKWNNLIQVDVDFSFTPPTAVGYQMSLV
jgi:DEAD/DEAH box helicase domain-containing protein